MTSDAILREAISFARRELNAAAETWSLSLQREVAITDPRVRALTAVKLASLLGPRQICATLELSGVLEGKSFLLVPEPDALTMVGAFSLLPADQVDERRRGRFGPNDFDAFTELVNHLAGAVRVALGERIGERFDVRVGKVSALDPTQPQTLENLFGPEPLLAVRCILEIEGFPPSRLLRIYRQSVMERMERPPAAEVTEFAEQQAPTASSIPEESTSVETAELVPAPSATPPSTTGTVDDDAPAVTVTDEPVESIPALARQFVERSSAQRATSFNGAVRSPSVADFAQDEAFPGEEAEGPDVHPELDRVLQIRLPIRVRLAHKTLTMGEVLKLAVGAVVEFPQSADRPLVLEVGGKAIAEGRATVKDQHFALELQRVAPPAERIRAEA